MLQKILVAVDGSAPSGRAARLAIELAGPSGEVTLAHVVPPMFIPAEIPFAGAPWAEDAVKLGEQMLDDTLKELGQPRVKRVNVMGPPAEALADLALEGKYDLMVVGSKGRGAVSRMLIGSVTDRLVHICRCPTLVVP
jgi:nucleotide-binding universal stress UspA family protein